MKIWSNVAISGIFILFSMSAFSCQKSTETKHAEPIIAEANIPVQGMTCGSCEYHIETEVKKQTGVITIKADHQKAMTLVKYDSTKISLDELVAAINETGYKASKPVSSDQ